MRGILPALLGISLWGGACAPRLSSPPAETAPEVRYRPAPPPDAAALSLVQAIPGGQWDAGLAGAVGELLALSTSRTSLLDPATTALVTARAGFPGVARYARRLNGGAFPNELLDEVAASAAGAPVDLAIGKRSWGDGTTLWILGVAPHRAELDPLPLQIALDDSVSVRVEPVEAAELRLFLAPPDGPVEEIALSSRFTAPLDRFHTPGAYRVEVVARRRGRSELLLLWTVFVEEPPPAPAPLRPLSALPPPDPAAAERQLYGDLNALRAAHGLRPVSRFPLFERLAREHSATMAATGVVDHIIAGSTEGVARRAEDFAHPAAVLHEDVAAALSAAQAMDLVQGSPGHLAALLCAACTHASIGVALEPVLDRPPRLFVTWEVMEFPQGEPHAIDHFNR